MCSLLHCRWLVCHILYIDVQVPLQSELYLYSCYFAQQAHEDGPVYFPAASIISLGSSVVMNFRRKCSSGEPVLTHHLCPDPKHVVPLNHAHNPQACAPSPSICRIPSHAPKPQLCALFHASVPCHSSSSSCPLDLQESPCGEHFVVHTRTSYLVLVHTAGSALVLKCIPGNECTSITPCAQFLVSAALIFTQA